MHHIPHPKNQAQTLMHIARDKGWSLGKQEALEIVAQLQGYKTWQICSSVVDAANAAVQETPARPTLLVEPCRNHEGKHLFSALVTTDTTMSARYAVWAEDEDEARVRLRQFAARRYEQNGGEDFDIDDANYRGAVDFYLGDPNDIEDLSTPVIEGDDMQAQATWKDEQGQYSVQLHRDAPDHADSEHPAATTVTLRCTRNVKGAAPQEKVLAGNSGYQCSGPLVDELRRLTDERTFTKVFEKMLNRPTKRSLEKFAKKSV